jgi:hypothetical protein
MHGLFNELLASNILLLHFYRGKKTFLERWHAHGMLSPCHFAAEIVAYFGLMFPLSMESSEIQLN